MSDWLQAVDFWHWWILAIVFVVLEIFSPAAFFLWLGVAAALVGVFVLFEPGMFWYWQLTLFAIASVAMTILGRRLFAGRFSANDHPHLNRRGEQYIDRVFTLDGPIINGQGKIRVDDSSWKISGEDLPGGTRIRVTGVDGVVLTVQKESP